MKKKLCYLLIFFVLSSCKTPAYLKVDDCYINKINKEYGSVYSALALVVSHYEYYLVFDDLKGQILFNRNNVHLYINSEYQIEPHFSIITQNGIENKINVKVDEGYVWISFLNAGSFPESTKINIIIEDLEFCHGDFDCETKDFSYSFAYQNDKIDKMQYMKFRGFNTWWRNPNVEICTINNEY